MKFRYKPAVPRTALRLAAAVISATTFGVMVVLPANLEAAGHGPRHCALLGTDATHAIAIA